MKKTLLILLAICLFSCSKNLNTPENLAQEVLKSLQESDFEKYKNCFMNLNDFKFSIEKFGKIENRKKDIEKAKDKVFRLNKMISKSYNELVNSSINWKETQYTHSTYKLDEKKNVKLIQDDDFFVYFLYEGNSYKLTMDECMLTDRGWVMHDYPIFKE